MLNRDVIDICKAKYIYNLAGRKNTVEERKKTNTEIKLMLQEKLKF